MDKPGVADETGDSVIRGDAVDVADVDATSLAVPASTVAVTVTMEDRVCALDTDTCALTVATNDVEADCEGALLDEPHSDALADAVTETDAAAVADEHADAVADADTRVLVDAREDWVVESDDDGEDEVRADGDDDIDFRADGDSGAVAVVDREPDAHAVDDAVLDARGETLVDAVGDRDAAALNVLATLPVGNADAVSEMVTDTVAVCVTSAGDADDFIDGDADAHALAAAEGLGTADAAAVAVADGDGETRALGDGDDDAEELFIGDTVACDAVTDAVVDP